MKNASGQSAEDGGGKIVIILKAGVLTHCAPAPLSADALAHRSGDFVPGVADALACVILEGKFHHQIGQWPVQIGLQLRIRVGHHPPLTMRLRYAIELVGKVIIVKRWW